MVCAQQSEYPTTEQPRLHWWWRWWWCEKFGYNRPKEAQHEMRYLMFLMSATFPFIWNIKQSGGCVWERIQRGWITSLEALWSRVLEWSPRTEFRKKCLLQTFQPRPPPHPGCVWGRDLGTSGRGTESQRDWHRHIFCFPPLHMEINLYNV